MVITSNSYKTGRQAKARPVAAHLYRCPSARYGSFQPVAPRKPEGVEFCPGCYFRPEQITLEQVSEWIASRERVIAILGKHKRPLIQGAKEHNERILVGLIEVRDQKEEWAATFATPD